MTHTDGDSTTWTTRPITLAIRHNGTTRTTMALVCSQFPSYAIHPHLTETGDNGRYDVSMLPAGRLANPRGGFRTVFGAIQYVETLVPLLRASTMQERDVAALYEATASL